MGGMDKNELDRRYDQVLGEVGARMDRVMCEDSEKSL